MHRMLHGQVFLWSLEDPVSADVEISQHCVLDSGQSAMLQCCWYSCMTTSSCSAALTCTVESVLPLSVESHPTSHAPLPSMAPTLSHQALASVMQDLKNGSDDMTRMLVCVGGMS